jgi:hypothetical protein
MTALPIGYAVPAELVLARVPPKTRAFASYEPKKSYCYATEQDYYHGYQESYYALTTCKDGWDCLRHYEILMNGCIPYFPDLPQCPPQTMTAFPKQLVLEAMALEGVDFEHRRIDFARFDHHRYQELATQLLDWTRERLTTTALARYFLQANGLTAEARVLFLSVDTKVQDYQRLLLFHGLRSLLGTRAVDVPRIACLYQDYPSDQPLYGKGFTYSRRLPVVAVERTEPPTGTYDLVVFGALHRPLPYHDYIKTQYPLERIAYVCGEDLHACSYQHDPERKVRLFLREW